MLNVLSTFEIWYRRVPKVMAVESQRPPLGGRCCTPKSNNLLYFLLFFNTNTETTRQFLFLESFFLHSKVKRHGPQFWSHLTLGCSGFGDTPV